MSSFLVTDATINYALNWMWANAQNSSNRYDYQAIGECGFDISRINELPHIGAQMKKLNIQALDARYGEGEAKEFGPLDYNFQSMAAADVYQAVKALKCWMYQCSEGDVPNEPLFKALENVAYQIMETVFCANPKYNTAKWDIPEGETTGVWLTA